MAKAPHRKPHLDDRTRAVGGPPLRVRREALSERTPGENSDAEVETHFLSIERAVGNITPFSMRLLNQDLIQSIGRKRPDMVYCYLHCAVNVLGPSVSDRRGGAVVPTVSNADVWLPTKGWVARTLFYQPATPLAIRQSPVEVASRLIDDAIGEALEQHEDNKFIYIVGATVALVRLK